MLLSIIFKVKVKVNLFQINLIHNCIYYKQLTNYYIN